MLDITVKTLDSNNHEFSVEDDMTVAEFKAHIASEVNVPADSQRLIHCGRVLQDDRPLSEYALHGKAVHLVQRAPPSRGGPPPGDANAAPPNQHQHAPQPGVGQPMLVGAFSVTGNHRLPHPHVHMPGSGQPGLPLGTSSSGARLCQARTMLELANQVLNAHSSGAPVPSYAAAMNAAPAAAPPGTAVPSAAASAAGVAIPMTFSGGVMSMGAGGAPVTAAMPLPMMGLMPGGAVPGRHVQVHLQRMAVPVVSTAIPGHAFPPTNVAPSVPGRPVQVRLQRMPVPVVSTATPGPAAAPTNAAPSVSGPRAARPPSTRTASAVVAHPGLPVYARVVDMLQTLLRRLTPYLQRYHRLMADDAQLTDAQAQSSARLFHHTSEALHYAAHAMHLISDMTVDLTQPPPRHIRARPVIFAEHRTMAAPAQAQINIRANRPNPPQQPTPPASGPSPATDPAAAGPTSATAQDRPTVPADSADTDDPAVADTPMETDEVHEVHIDVSTVNGHGVHPAPAMNDNVMNIVQAIQSGLVNAHLNAHAPGLHANVHQQASNAAAASAAQQAAVNVAQQLASNVAQQAAGAAHLAAMNASQSASSAHQAAVSAAHQAAVSAAQQAAANAMFQMHAGNVNHTTAPVSSSSSGAPTTSSSTSSTSTSSSSVSFSFGGGAQRPVMTGGNVMMQPPVVHSMAGGAPTAIAPQFDPFLQCHSWHTATHASRRQQLVGTAGGAAREPTSQAPRDAAASQTQSGGDTGATGAEVLTRLKARGSAPTRVDTLSSLSDEAVQRGSEPWHYTVPEQWLSTITHDLRQQQSAAPVAPFSDGYLSAQPASRRASIRAEKPPPGPPAQLLRHCLQEALAACRVAGGDGPQRQEILQELVDDEAVQREATGNVATTMSARVSRDPACRPSSDHPHGPQLE